MHTEKSVFPMFLGVFTHTTKFVFSLFFGLFTHTIKPVFYMLFDLHAMKQYTVRPFSPGSMALFHNSVGSVFSCPCPGLKKIMI